MGRGEDWGQTGIHEDKRNSQKQTESQVSLSPYLSFQLQPSEWHLGENSAISTDA